jgi:hypothetical protein
VGNGRGEECRGGAARRREEAEGHGGVALAPPVRCGEGRESSR